MLAVGQHVIIGSDGAAFATARAALERGYEAVVLVPRGAPSVRKVPSMIVARDFNPRDKVAVKDAIKLASTVYYCCGSATLPLDQEEPAKLARLLEAVKGVGARFVYCDAPYAYGVQDRPLSEEMPQRARDPMGSFLAALAQYVLQAHRMGGIEVVLARHADLIGPQILRSPFGEQFIAAVLKDRIPPILGGFQTQRSLTYSADLGRSLVLLAEQTDTWGQLWHLPSTHVISPERLVNLIRESGGLPPLAHKHVHEIKSRVPMFSSQDGMHPAQRKLARFYEESFVFSSAKFERAFGMHATDLKELVGETVQSVMRS